MAVQRDFGDYDKEFIMKSIFTCFLIVSVGYCATGDMEDPNLSQTDESRKQKAMESFSENVCISIDSASDPNLLSRAIAENPVSIKIYNSALEDAGVLSAFTNLRELVLVNSGIKDLTFVSKLKNLEHLDLDHNQITDLAPIASCQRLKVLSIRDNQISNLTVLSSLGNLNKVDIGKNPLEGAHINQIILKVREKNPSVTILNKDVVPDAQDVLYAKGKYSAFCSTAAPVFDEGFAVPFLPELPHDVLTAGQLLQKNKNLDYITETAILLMKFCNMKSVYYRPGGLFQRDDFFVDSLFIFFNLPEGVFGDDPSVGGIEKWVSENRDKFSPSVLLDLEIEKCEQIKQDELEELRRLKEEQLKLTTKD